MNVLFATAAALVLVMTATADAQRPAAGARRQLPAAARQRGQAQSESVGPGRARLEAEVRRNFARLVRQRVGLSEAQMTRLVPITQRYEQQRRSLQMEEREARMGLRLAQRDEQTADAKHVEQLLLKFMDVQKRRVALFESEQRDLAEFMTPMQRAKLMAMQEQVRRQLEQMRQRRAP